MIESIFKTTKLGIFMIDNYTSMAKLNTYLAKPSKLGDSIFTLYFGRFICLSPLDTGSHPCFRRSVPHLAALSNTPKVS